MYSGISALLKGPADPESISDAERAEFNRLITNFHQSRGVSFVPPTIGRPVDCLSFMRTVREQYGQWTAVDSEDLMAIAKFLRIKLNSVPNGLATLRSVYDTYLLPIDAALAAPPRPTPLAALMVQPTTVFAGDLKPYTPAPALVPAILPHAALDLSRIALGVEQREAWALKALDGYFAVVSEGRMAEARSDEFVRCGIALGRLVASITPQDSTVLASHALHSWSLALQRGGFPVDREAVEQCERIAATDSWSLRLRVLAARATLSSQPSLSLGLSLLRFAKEQELREVGIGIVAQSADRVDGRILALELYPSLESDLQPEAPLRILALGLVHLTLEAHAHSLASVKEHRLLEICLVSPLVVLLEKGDAETREAALSCILRLGVHLELRETLNSFLDRLTALAWRDTPDGPIPAATQSLWNVVTELLTQ